jgi:hypothetical protein
MRKVRRRRESLRKLVSGRCLPEETGEARKCGRLNRSPLAAPGMPTP